ncbi:MAG: hypothetical protein E7557_01620 [Ruminococcaceae bacterium]|nr:hypothetical protein [Oscillospiraceae bacterium]
MAVKIFGTCSGSSGKKYDIWLEVTENSHSIKNNTSNLTINLKLKRNDGYTGSAYNLNESENFVKITINNTAKSSRNLTIDTRNNATVTLCSWSGDFTHNQDGSLTVSLGGSFTMSGTSLSGGSVSGSFKCITIPRASSFSLDKTGAKPDDNVTLTISAASKDFKHTAVFEIGSYKKTLSLASGITKASLTVPVEWLNAIPNSKSGSVKVTLKTYNSNTLLGSSTKHFKITIPETEEYLPEFEFNLSYDSRGMLPGIWSATLQNITLLTVTIPEPVIKYGATLANCIISVGSQSKSGLSNTFDLIEAGVITAKINITDSRGFCKKKEFLIQVDGYAKPKVYCTSIYRCDSSGKPVENGTSVAIEFQKEYSVVRGLNLGRVYARYKKNGSTDYGSSTLLNSSPFVINGAFDVASSYDFILSITDEVTKTPFEVSRTLPSGSIPFNIKQGGKGAAFGCYAEADNELTVGYDLNVKGVFKYDSLNNSVTAMSCSKFVHLDVRKYSSLRLISINAKVEILNNLPANYNNELFQIGGLSFKHTYPLPVHFDYHLPSSGVISAYINTLAIVKVANQEGFTAGDTVNINGIIDY